MNRLKIGIVGLNFGRYIVGQLTDGPGREWLELAAVCDMDQAKARAHAEQHRVKAYFDLDALLADREIPAIGLFTGPVGRADLIRGWQGTAVSIWAFRLSTALGLEPTWPQFVVSGA